MFTHEGKNVLDATIMDGKIVMPLTLIPVAGTETKGKAQVLIYQN